MSMGLSMIVLIAFFLLFLIVPAIVIVGVLLYQRSKNRNP